VRLPISSAKGGDLGGHHLGLDIFGTAPGRLRICSEWHALGRAVFQECS